MRRRLAILKHFKPSIVLLILAMVITLLAHPHIIVPIILAIGAIIMGWQNYKILKAQSTNSTEVEDSNGNRECN